MVGPDGSLFPVDPDHGRGGCDDQTVRPGRDLRGLPLLLRKVQRVGHRAVSKERNAGPWRHRSLSHLKPVGLHSPFVNGMAPDTSRMPTVTVADSLIFFKVSVCAEAEAAGAMRTAVTPARVVREGASRVLTWRRANPGLRKPSSRWHCPRGPGRTWLPARQVRL